MFKWKKMGLIYRPEFDGGWRDNSALTPTPIELNHGIIRIYLSFRDKDGVGRIGYVDVDANDPGKIVGISDRPVLDIGELGMFDDNGMILGDVIKVKNKIYMYYVGFQLVKKAKFLAYTGLAIGDESGQNFARVSSTPVLDRSDEGRYIRAIHSVIYEDNKFKTWYAVGNGWEKIDGVNYPQYDINYTESIDGKNFGLGTKVVTNDEENKEYRIGRPRVYKLDDSYIMNFTYGTTDGKYLAGQATSRDGFNWDRDDNAIGISPSTGSWDSLHLSYPSVLRVSTGKTYMFYNGNEMGKHGFGYATLE
jgi:predicted GH43/DUF377 family glycosyl hydrolase